MEKSKNLRRPTNWQDFETLCKKFWGDIWNCPEIKKMDMQDKLNTVLTYMEFHLAKTSITVFNVKAKTNTHTNSFLKKK